MLLRIRLYSFRFCQLPHPLAGQVPVVAQGGAALAVAVDEAELSALDEDAAGLAA